jgi:hypothetical protein
MNKSVYELTDSIPLPSISKYPFGTMKVGQSFFTPDTAHRVRSAAAAFGKKKGLRFACRIVTEEGIRGFRCWRIE